MIIAALQDKIVIFEVYEKILKDSDNAYSQVMILLNLRLLIVLKNYIRWLRMKRLS